MDEWVHVCGGVLPLDETAVVVLGEDGDYVVCLDCLRKSLFEMDPPADGMVGVQGSTVLVRELLMCGQAMMEGVR